MSNLPYISISVESEGPMPEQFKKSSKANGSLNKHRQQHNICKTGAYQSGKLHSGFAGYMAFGAAVFVSVMAAAAVASHDLPLMLGGF